MLHCFSSNKSYFCVFCVHHLPQVTSANAFAQTLRRYTSLNHLAQAARAVLQNTAQINQMLSDLNRVDFANVQVGLVCILCTCFSLVYFLASSGCTALSK